MDAVPDQADAGDAVQDLIRRMVIKRLEQYGARISQLTYGIDQLVRMVMQPAAIQDQLPVRRNGRAEFFLQKLQPQLFGKMAQRFPLAELVGACRVNLLHRIRQGSPPQIDLTGELAEHMGKAGLFRQEEEGRSVQQEDVPAGKRSQSRILLQILIAGNAHRSIAPPRLSHGQEVIARGRKFPKGGTVVPAVPHEIVRDEDVHGIDRHMADDVPEIQQAARGKIEREAMCGHGLPPLAGRKKVGDESAGAGP